MNRRSMVKALAASAVGALAMPAAVRANRFAPEEKVPPAPAHLRNARWSEDRAFRYMERVQEVKVCNFVLSDGTNLFDEPNTALIRHEIGLASEVARLNAVRLFVSMADFQISPTNSMRAMRAFWTSDIGMGYMSSSPKRTLPTVSIFLSASLAA